DDSTRYYSGGPICIRNVNAWSNIINAYTEGFQPSIYLNDRSKVDGGDNGAGVVGGSFHHILYGLEMLNNADLFLPKNATNTRHITIGGTSLDYAAPLTVINDADLSGIIPVAKFETLNRNSTSLLLKNMHSTGTIGYDNTDFNFYTSSHIAQLNSTGFFASGSNTMDIGAPSTKWKTGYFGTSLFSPLINGSSSSAGNLTLNSTSHATKGNIFFGSASVYNEANGFLGLNTPLPSTYLDINGDKVRVRTAKTPSSSTDTGSTGDICWDENYIYVCVLPNTWKRVAISTW
ncbi:MAG TPA: hypothetical protein VK484_08715, partial [Ferruginibacter sp.]|nr:hypothetical protein [Ferruginibacter sp.]